MATGQARQQRPQFTAATARRFDRYSIANAVAVKASLKCGCEPYKDVFTYNRWRALGYQVQRGQHAIKLPLIKEVEDNEDGETRRIFALAMVFCRHQVQPS